MDPMESRGFSGPFGWKQAGSLCLKPPWRSSKNTSPLRFLGHKRNIWMFPKIVGFPPKSSHFNRVFHYFHHPFWGIPIFGNTHILPGNSAGDLFGMVSSRDPFKG